MDILLIVGLLSFLFFLFSLKEIKKVKKKAKEMEMEKKLGEKIDKTIQEYNYKNEVEKAKKKLDKL